MMLRRRYRVYFNPQPSASTVVRIVPFGQFNCYGASLQDSRGRVAEQSFYFERSMVRSSKASGQNEEPYFSGSRQARMDSESDQHRIRKFRTLAQFFGYFESVNHWHSDVLGAAASAPMS